MSHYRDAMADDARTAPISPAERLFAHLSPSPEDTEIATAALPVPGSPELLALPKMNATLAAIYTYLYEHRHDADPPTETQIRDHIASIAGQAQSQAGRRKRDLYPFFLIAKVKIPGSNSPGYRLEGWKTQRARSDVQWISGRTRAEVLSPARCAMCGKTPLDDQVKLVVDHKIPQAWGGTDHIDNLQPLCEECNGGKKDLFSSYDSHADKIKLAINYDEPHRRIGELLKAFNREWVPGSLIGIVASAMQYQEDWQKRTRELRLLGWDIQWTKRKEGGRFRTDYRAAHWEPWGEGLIRPKIQAEELRRREARPSRPSNSAE